MYIQYTYVYIHICISLSLYIYREICISSDVIETVMTYI